MYVAPTLGADDLKASPTPGGADTPLEARGNMGLSLAALEDSDSSPSSNNVEVVQTLPFIGNATPPNPRFDSALLPSSSTGEVQNLVVETAGSSDESTDDSLESKSTLNIHVLMTHTRVQFQMAK